MTTMNLRTILSVFAISVIALGCSNNQPAEEPIRPPYLQPGDSVGLMTISSPISLKSSQGKIDSLINIVKGWGVNIRYGENLFKHDYNAFTVPDKERAEELMDLVRNDNLKAIIFYRGGYGAIRIMEYLDLEEIKKHPKWIMGYSDVTTLHSVLSNIGMESIHGAMLNSYYLKTFPDSAAITVSDALFGRLKSYKFAPYPQNKFGEVEGKLVGGNMTLLSISEGTPYSLKIDGPTILFIEEVDESMNAVDGMMQQLEKSGKLSQIKGLVIGNFRGITDNEYPWGITPYDVIKHYTDKLNIPVAYGITSGHGRPNYALYLGRKVTLKVDESGSEIIF